MVKLYRFIPDTRTRWLEIPVKPFSYLVDCDHALGNQNCIDTYSMKILVLV